MPTGYTYGILNGEIKTFEDFATGCIRAFGAALHMRDLEPSEKYKPAEVSSYYKERFDRILAEIDEWNSMTDDEVTDREKSRIASSIESVKKGLEQAEANLIKLNKVLKDIQDWEPPTDDHIEFKSFMEQQVLDTIKHDADVGYYKRCLIDLMIDLSNIPTADYIRSQEMERLNKSLSIAKEGMTSEIKRVNERNNWVKDIVDTFKNTEAEG